MDAEGDGPCLRGRPERHWDTGLFFLLTQYDRPVTFHLLFNKKGSVTDRFSFIISMLCECDTVEDVAMDL